MGTVLEAQGLTKRFGGLLAVNNLSFSVDEGRVLGVVGPNGSGKTTTFNLLTGFIRPDFGKVIFENHEITNLKPHRIVRLGVARTFQLVRIFRGLSVYDNIRSAALLRAEGALDRRIGEILSVIGLVDKHGNEAGSLPIGDLKRLEIGRALATNPRLLLLDEPFSGLSHAEVNDIAALLRKLISQGLTVIIVEHVLRELKRLAQQVLVLDFGKKIAEGNFDEVYLNRLFGRRISEGQRVLEIRDLIVRYGAAHAVKGVSINVRKGEFVALIGPNGAGKSTLLRAISRLVPASTGELSFEGRRIDRFDPWDVARIGIAHVPEGRKLVGTASVLDNLKLGAYAHWHELKTRLSFVYEIFPVLRERATQQARTLSGGEQQIVAIARALMARPKLLLLDEVTFGLAPRMVHLLTGKLQKFHELGISILLAEQNAELALTLAHRCYLLENGSVAKEGLAADLRMDPAVRASYLGL